MFSILHLHNFKSGPSISALSDSGVLTEGLMDYIYTLCAVLNCNTSEDLRLCMHVNEIEKKMKN